MNRSVVKVIIATGMLWSGSGIAAAPAAADPVGPGTDSGADTPRPARPPGRVSAEDPDDGEGGDWPCEWSRVCRPGSHKRWRGDSIMGGIPPAVIPVRVPAMAPVEPAAVPELGRTPAQSVPTSEPVAPAAQTSPIPALVPVVAPAVSLPPPAAPLPAAPPPAVSPPAVPPVAPLSRPAPVSLPQAPLESRIGYPDELRDADFGEVVSMALPGLAAIAGMTVLGGLFGYRQAKAGYVLRTAGVGRFLQ